MQCDLYKLFRVTTILQVKCIWCQWITIFEHALFPLNAEFLIKSYIFVRYKFLILYSTSGAAGLAMQYIQRFISVTQNVCSKLNLGR